MLLKFLMQKKSYPLKAFLLLLLIVVKFLYTFSFLRSYYAVSSLNWKFISLPNLLILYYILRYKILAMRHPRRLVLSGCLGALIVSGFLIFIYLLANLTSDYLAKPHNDGIFWNGV